MNHNSLHAYPPGVISYVQNFRAMYAGWDKMASLCEAFSMTAEVLEHAVAEASHKKLLARYDVALSEEEIVDVLVDVATSIFLSDRIDQVTELAVTQDGRLDYVCPRRMEKSLGAIAAYVHAWADKHFRS